MILSHLRSYFTTRNPAWDHLESLDTHLLTRNKPLLHPMSNSTRIQPVKEVPTKYMLAFHQINKVGFFISKVHIALPSSMKNIEVICPTTPHPSLMHFHYVQYILPNPLQVKNRFATRYWLIVATV
jgi:hypothetical protein